MGFIGFTTATKGNRLHVNFIVVIRSASPRLPIGTRVIHPCRIVAKTFFVCFFQVVVH